MCRADELVGDEGAVGGKKTNTTVSSRTAALSFSAYRLFAELSMPPGCSWDARRALDWNEALERPATRTFCTCLCNFCNSCKLDAAKSSSHAFGLTALSYRRSKCARVLLLMKCEVVSLARRDDRLRSLTGSRALRRALPPRAKPGSQTV